MAISNTPQSLSIDFTKSLLEQDWFQQNKLFEQQLKHCLLKDRFTISKKRLQLLKANNQDKEQQAKWLEAFIASSETFKQRAEITLDIQYPQSLPVSSSREEIKDVIRQNQVVVVAGETGSGKTTQLPKMALELGLGRAARIAHTQPRRVAASAVARRLADELKLKLGEEIGYQVRFSDQTNDKTLVKLMTDGV